MEIFLGKTSFKSIIQYILNNKKTYIKFRPSYGGLPSSFYGEINIIDGVLNRDILNPLIDSLSKIPHNYTLDTGAIQEIIFGSNITRIDTGTFNSNNLTNVIMSDSITSIGEHAFLYNENLKNLVIGNNVVIIENKAFYRCSRLTNLIIPDSVITIGSQAFGDCVGLKSITIGNNVTTIKSQAFISCI